MSITSAARRQIGLGGLVRTVVTRMPRFGWVLVAIAVWVVLWIVLRGHDTLPLGQTDTTHLHDWIADQVNKLQSGSNIVMTCTNGIANALNSVIGWLQHLFSQPDYPRPVPQIGWLGVTAIGGWVGLAVAGWKYGVLVTLSVVAFGVLGYFPDSIDTLIITFVAVLISVVIGIPLGVWIGNSRRATAVITPILDFMQTMPSFVYLLPLVILFSIGSAAATIATLIYAIPPVIRITGHGIRTVSTSAIEATDSLGQTRWQRLVKVQAPMARRTIIVGLNQTTMAALSMVTIAALIAGPGLGGPIVQALAALQIGQALVAGLCIVIMAIMLDRTTTAAAERAQRLARAGGGSRRLRQGTLAGAGIVTLVCIYLSHSYLQLAQFPASWNVGDTLQSWFMTATNWISTNLDTATGDIQDKFSTLILNPVQSLLANSPWWLVVAAVLVIAGLLGGRWAFGTSVVCLAGFRLLGVWQDTMVTLTMVIAATFFVMILAILFGVWMGRSRAADMVIRPVLDAGQTMPPFVYLIPVLALFGPTRFTAIVAGVIYAAPVAIKLVADGIRGVAATTVEAAVACGSNSNQVIWKVQVPMARSSVVLAANQGLLYVLSMVVIGGMVGGGALGYDIVAGFSQENLQGKGLAAGLTIVLMGVMLDRITARAATRGRSTGGSAVGYE